MSYPLKYLISFAVAFFIFSFIFLVGNIFFVDVPSFNPLSWVINLTVLELFSNIFVIQILAVIFTFAFWITQNEVKEWFFHPIASTFKILVIFSLVGFFSYSIKEWIQQDVSLKVMSIEENNRNINFFKIRILELKAQKSLVEERILILDGPSSEDYKKLNWELMQILESLYSFYSRYYSIAPSVSLQEDIEVVRQEINLLKEINLQDYSSSFKVPFTDLTENEIYFLVQKLEDQLDYANALYLSRILSFLYPNNEKYKVDGNRIESLIRNSITGREGEILRSNFLEKQGYYLALRAGNSLKAYYGIVDFIKRNRDDVGAQEIYSQVLKSIQGKYIFEQDIKDLFEIGGLKSFFFLNDSNSSYKEYVYLGKIVESEDSFLVRDISFFRFNSNSNLVLYATIPYATFDTINNRLIFNVIDKYKENSYLKLDIKKGKLDQYLRNSWEINYSLSDIPAFSLSTFKEFSSLSFTQLWKASSKAYEMGDKQRVNIIFYSIYERVLAPLAFLIASFWLASFSLLHPVFGERKWIKALLLVVSAPALGALFNFFFSDIVSVFSFLLMPNIFGLIITLIIVFFLFLSSLLLFMKSIRKAAN